MQRVGGSCVARSSRARVFRSPAAIGRVSRCIARLSTTSIQGASTTPTNLASPDAANLPPAQRSRTVCDAVLASLDCDVAALRAQQRSHDAHIADEISRVCVLGAKGLKSGGRILTTGMGKSGHVAHRLASSLASLGLDAMYVCASDWGHGHLGYARPGDVGVVFSHSGMSAECVHAAAQLRERGVVVCGVMGNRVVTKPHRSDGDDSSRSHAGGDDAGVPASDARTTTISRSTRETPLCGYCDHTVSYGLGGTTEPFGIVPTSSVVIQESISNAIINAMIAAHGVSKEDFLRNHPGGGHVKATAALKLNPAANK